MGQVVRWLPGTVRQMALRGKWRERDERQMEQHVRQVERAVLQEPEIVQ